MGPLGCAEEYTIGIYDRTGGRQHGTVDPAALDWSRVLDDTSEANITVPYQGPDCCKLLGEARSWCNELAIFRDQQLVWQGPLVRIEHRGDDTLLAARDVTQWLFRRKIRNLIDFTGTSNADLAVIAAALIEHGFAPDDPNVLAYLMITAAGIVGERKYAKNSGYILDHLRELARTGLDFTTLGRRILLMGEGPLGRLPGLSDEHFVGPLAVIEDGLSAITHATVVGKGITAEAGGIGTCGLLEFIATEEEIQDATSAQAEAGALVVGGNPAPLFLEVPDNSQLAPETPIGINDLIPGAIIPVTSEATCRLVAADLRLIRMKVAFSEADGEKVGITLAPLGIDSPSTAA
ncbi:hypothetical protein ACIBEJ_00340 [Nonomuraea sp. NPDC050790]|uniref:hypothetical protein n=1 Tax=Nonomuraea sp. NPDC050790 TaxID=3364371 RepID=UPI003797D7DE